MIHIRPARLNDKGSTLKHWEDTILNSKSFNQISTFLNDEQKEKLLATGKEEFNLWGDTRKHQTIWSSMTPGEIILFYGDYKFHTKGKVETTFQNKVLAEELWPDYDPEKGPHLNIYSISGLEDIEIDYPSNRHYFQTAEGKPYTAKFIQRALGFKEERVSSKFMAKVELGYEANSEDDKHTQKGRPRSTPVKRAEIYRITFSVDNKNMVYVGQDIKIDSEGNCDPNYFSSSLVVAHYKKLYGQEIMTKKPILKLENTTQGVVNDQESKFIKESKKEIENKPDWYSLNYTGLKG